jgi:hypothetical protein
MIPPPRDPPAALRNDTEGNRQAARCRRRLLELAAYLRCQPWEIRRARYLDAAGRADLLAAEGLERLAERLRL